MSHDLPNLAYLSIFSHTQSEFSFPRNPHLSPFIFQQKDPIHHVLSTDLLIALISVSSPISSFIHANQTIGTMTTK